MYRLTKEFNTNYDDLVFKTKESLIKFLIEEGFIRLVEAI
jgi:hypothetical protein